jgi:hypothetical protein
MHTSNALDPQSPQARAIYDLGIVSTIVFVLIFGPGRQISRLCRSAKKLLVQRADRSSKVGGFFTTKRVSIVI